MTQENESDDGIASLDEVTLGGYNGDDDPDPPATGAVSMDTETQPTESLYSNPEPNSRVEV